MAEDYRTITITEVIYRCDECGNLMRAIGGQVNGKHIHVCNECDAIVRLATCYPYELNRRTD